MEHSKHSHICVVLKGIALLFCTAQLRVKNWLLWPDVKIRLSALTTCYFWCENMLWCMVMNVWCIYIAVLCEEYTYIIYVCMYTRLYIIYYYGSHILMPIVCTQYIYTYLQWAHVQSTMSNAGLTCGTNCSHLSSNCLILASRLATSAWVDD